MRRLAILNDHERQALDLADWSAVAALCDIRVFDRPLKVPDEAARELQGVEIICLVRERTAVPSDLIDHLPALRFISVTGPFHRTLDLSAASRRGIVVSHTLPRDAAIYATAELTWGLILSAARHIASSDREMRNGNWPSRLGQGLHGRCLGLLGLGQISRRVALIGQAFNMEVIAWSQNLTHEAAALVGVRRVDRDELFARSDVLSVHVVLSERTRGLVGARELSQMKSSAILVNTSRGSVVDEQALVTALTQGVIAGAGLDVFDQEPLAAMHPLRSLSNVVLTPHLGFSTKDIFRAYFEDTIDNVLAYLAGAPVRRLA